MHRWHGTPPTVEGAEAVCLPYCPGFKSEPPALKTVEMGQIEAKKRSTLELRGYPVDTPWIPLSRQVWGLEDVLGSPGFPGLGYFPSGLVAQTVPQKVRAGREFPLNYFPHSGTLKSTLNVAVVPC